MHYLDICQKVVNGFYKVFGDKGFVITMQIWINQKRNAKDLVDKKELQDNGFVQ